MGQSWSSPALAAGWEAKAQREEGPDPRQAAGRGGARECMEAAPRDQDLCRLRGPHPSQNLPGCWRGSLPIPPAVPVPLFNYKQRFSPSLDRATDAHGFATIWPQFLAWDDRAQ